MARLLCAVSLTKSHGVGQTLPRTCVWREPEGRLRKAFAFHSHPPKSFSHLIDFTGFCFPLSKCRGKFRLVPTSPPACSGSHAAEEHPPCKQMLQPCLQMPQAWTWDVAVRYVVSHPPAGRNSEFATLFSSSLVEREKRRGAGAPGFTCLLSSGQQGLG